MKHLRLIAICLTAIVCVWIYASSVQYEALADDVAILDRWTGKVYPVQQMVVRP